MIKCSTKKCSRKVRMKNRMIPVKWYEGYKPTEGEAPGWDPTNGCPASSGSKAPRQRNQGMHHFTASVQSFRQDKDRYENTKRY